MKKILAIVLAAVMLIGLVACGGGGGSTPAPSNSAAPAESSSPSGGGSSAAPAPSESAAPSGGGDAPAPAAATDTITVAVSNDAGTLSPAFSTSTTFAVVCSMMEPLWDVDQEGNVKMILCESVDFVSDTEQILHLRQGVKFHNGNPFTASDLLFSMNIHKDAGSSGAPRVQTVDFEKTKVIDDYTLDLFLLAPTIANWTVLSQCICYDEESYDPAVAASAPNGTGPYKFVSYTPNSEIKMERNEEYWGDAPAFKYINVKILAEDSQRMNALETGLIDLGLIATTDYDYATGLDNIDVIGYYSGNYEGVSFNFGPNSVFYHNRDARAAVCHAINGDAILQTVFLGHGAHMHAQIVPYCFDYEDRFNDLSDIYSIGYNPELAKQLAESSGLAGQTIDIMTAGAASEIRAAEMVQAMLSEIGVNANIVNYDPATVWQLMYDPEADWDIDIGQGITPNRRCGDQLLNGVRYSQVLTTPGSFRDNEEYLKKAPLCMSLQDEKELGDLLYEMLKWYEDEVLAFALFDIEHFIGASQNIDPDSVTLSVGSSGVRYYELRPRG